MNPTLSKLFTIFSRLALVGWLFLFFAPLTRSLFETIDLDWLTINTVVGSIVIVLCAAYTYTLFNKALDKGEQPPKGNFSSLKGVIGLFKHPRAVLTGWIHYLAFDLFVGLYILNHAQQFSINHLWLVPALFFTLMLGPVGLLLYSIAGYLFISGFSLI